MAHTIIRLKTLNPETDEFQVTIVPDVNQPKKSLRPYKIRLTKLEHMYYNTVLRARNSMASFHTNNKNLLPQYHKQLQDAGRKLYQCVFSHAAKQTWNDVLKDGRGRYCLEIDASLWRFPWELLYHEEDNSEYLEKMSKPIIRRISGHSNPSETVHLNYPTIYFVGADPIDHATRAPEQLKKLIDQIPQDIDSARLLRQDRLNQQDNLNQWERIVRDLKHHPPDILHIVAHGIIGDDKENSGFAFEGTSRNSEIIVDLSALVELLVEIKQVKLLIIASCQSAHFFEESPKSFERLFAQTDLKSAVLMGSDISAETIIKFTEIFYGALWQQCDVAHAVAVARSILRSSKSETNSLQWSVPMIYESTTLDPFGKWLKEIRDYTNMPLLQLEHLEEVQINAQRVDGDLKKLIELRHQSRPSPSSLRFASEKLRRTISEFEDSMLVFRNKRYTPEDEALLHLIRLASSETIPTIDNFVNLEMDWDESLSVLSASDNLLENVDYAIDMVRTRALV